jgi:hypothetical protein
MTNDQWMSGNEIPCHVCGTQGRPLHQRNAEGWACAPCYRDRIAELEAERDRMIPVVYATPDGISDPILHQQQGLSEVATATEWEPVMVQLWAILPAGGSS